MKIMIKNNYEEMSKQVAYDIIETMQLYNKPLMSPATGDTTTGLYKELVHLIREQQTYVSEWYFVSLDEWMNMNEKDEKSTRYRLNVQLFQPLNIKDERICFFDGRTDDPQHECEGVEKFIHQHGGIDLAILGLGLNGHVGMNEPHTSFSSRSHIAALDDVTQQASAKKYAKDPALFTRGLTLGLATLFEAKHIFLLASGAHKAAIIKKILEAGITEELPASLLRRHEDLRIYLDKEAAGLIEKE